MGYGAEQMRELGETINNTPTDLVIIATPIDLRRVVQINRPSQRVSYELQEIGQPTLMDVLRERFGGRQTADSGRRREAEKARSSG
jgi:predicted GTPase